MDLTRHNLLWTKLPEKWIDGMFLGNGEIGAMIWGDGAPLKITLDKMDFWEERMGEHAQWGAEHNWEDMKNLIKQKKQNELLQKYERYSAKAKEPTPTRLPVPRLELKLGKYEGCKLELNLQTATLEGKINELAFSSYIHSELNFLIMNIDSSKDIEIKVDYDHLEKKAKNILDGWGYAPLRYEQFLVSDLEIHTCFQEIPEGQGGLLISWTIIKADNHQTIKVHMASQNNLPNFDKNVDIYNQIEDFVKKEWESHGLIEKDEFKKEHIAYWEDYWNKSYLSIPDNIVENLYYIELYKLACNSRKNKYPTSLQGIWTLDGKMPPWAGDYHIDMNIQEAYWPIFSSNRLELGEPLFRVMTKNLPKFEKYCKDFYGCEGAMTTCAISLQGANLHGYYNTEIWPGNTAWLAHMYWIQWKYTKDKQFLKESAFPYLHKSFQVYEHILEKNEYDEYYIPLSSSPEYNEHNINAWGSNPTADLALVLWLVKALLESIEILNLNGDKMQDLKEKCQEIEEDLVFYPADVTGFMVFENQRYDYPHRHMTHLFPIHPFHLVTVEGDRDDKVLIHDSLRNLRKIGDWEYTGWTLPWLSMMASWSNDYWLSYKWLNDYFNFIKSNTMHINGDINDHGICMYIYEPMTLEAGFCFINAVNELLLKSWGGIIRVFEGLPLPWQDSWFYRLRAEGAFLVSGVIEKKNLKFVLIESEMGGKCTIKNSFLGKELKLNLYTYTNKSVKFMAECQVRENHDFPTLQFDTDKEGKYLIVPADFDFKVIGEIANIITQLENEEYKPVKNIYNGQNWFGSNPHLPK